MRISHLWISTAVCGLLWGCQPQTDHTHSESANHHNIDAAQSSVDQAFEALLDKHWNWSLSLSPVFATSLGVRDYDDQIGDPSLEAYAAQIEKTKAYLADFNALDVSALSEDNQLNHKLMTLQLETDIEASQFGGKYMIMTNRGGPHLTVTGMASRLPFCLLYTSPSPRD